jgi:hypothetical protein
MRGGFQNPVSQTTFSHNIYFIFMFTAIRLTFRIIIGLNRVFERQYNRI